MSSKKSVFFVMGVSGSGKSTVGRLLAKVLNCPFFDGDDYHPEANIKKMSAGNPLNDDDRKTWLNSLNLLAKQHQKKGAVIACSALKQSYRHVLSRSLNDSAKFVYLKGSYKEISNRLSQRNGHFMPAALLQSQFDTLEEPEDAITVSIRYSPKEIVQKILK
ncbi:gluconokinase [Costertonia aggregata]|uniref:Gluconokinase n=1 Tax=Costertonia aggregata TaxID=343403 RepID=A0A7H9AJT6_9FLAO|nr:gluconokinase [Costertonia aggregata]QLG43839.1 gluconokinase [Costertonia aggregata]